MTLVDTILGAVANGCSVEIHGGDGLVFADVRTRRGDIAYTCRREVARLMFNQAAIGADAVLAEAVRSAADAVLNAAKEQGQ